MYEQKLVTEPLASRETAYVVEFAVKFGGEIMVCGGEMWRMEEVIKSIFKAYDFEECSVYMELHTVSISGKRKGEVPLLRQRSVGDISPDLEKLTRLSRLRDQIVKNPPKPSQLEDMLEEALIDPKPYPVAVIWAGTCIALTCINFIIGGTWMDAFFGVLGMFIFLLVEYSLNSIPGTSHLLMRVALAFIVGMIDIGAMRLGLLSEPYMAIIVTAFGLIPGIPLINAFREVICGRALCGLSLFLQAFIETAFFCGGFGLALSLMGVN